MRGWRFALSRRWFSYLGLAIIFAIACVALSRWQVDRTTEAQNANRLIERNFSSEPISVREALPTLTSFEQSAEWRQVSVTGTYLLAEQLLVRNRPYNGQPGFEVLVPLLLEDGRVFVVNRGYVPIGNRQDYPDHIPEPHTGVVTVTVHLQGNEPNPFGRTGVPGQLASVHLQDVATLVDKPTYTGAYGLVIAETPAAATLPVPRSKPVFDEGLHVSYAIQWLLFGVMAFFGLGYAVRQEYRLRNADDPDERERADERAQRLRAKPPTDADVEDEIVSRMPRPAR